MAVGSGMGHWIIDLRDGLARPAGRIVQVREEWGDLILDRTPAPFPTMPSITLRFQRPLLVISKRFTDDCRQGELDEWPSLEMSTLSVGNWETERAKNRL